MQDRFKFRYNFNNKIYDVSAIDLSHSRGEIVSLDGMETLMCKLDLDNLIPCIGKKDKNDKLIYEGDIAFKKGSKNYKKEKLYSVVIWDSMYAQFNLSDENGIHQIPSNSNNIEIVGNIYENPELLEESFE